MYIPLYFQYALQELPQYQSIDRNLIYTQAPKHEDYQSLLPICKSMYQEIQKNQQHTKEYENSFEIKSRGNKIA